MADSKSQTAECPHGYRHPVACPQCEPELYEITRPQVERWLQKQADAGRIVRLK